MIATKFCTWHDSHFRWWTACPTVVCVFHWLMPRENVLSQYEKSLHMWCVLSLSYILYCTQSPLYGTQVAFLFRVWSISWTNTGLAGEIIWFITLDMVTKEFTSLICSETRRSSGETVHLYRNIWDDSLVYLWCDLSFLLATGSLFRIIQHIEIWPK